MNTCYQLLWLFFIYSFCGWIAEITVTVIGKRKFINRGVVKGPFCCVYGFAAVAVTIGTRGLHESIFFLFLGSLIIATFVQWLTGRLLEKLHQYKWWDYSDKKWNIDGYICFSYSILWGVIGVVILKYINPLLLSFYHLISWSGFKIILLFALLLLIIDSICSHGTILHIRKQKIRKEKTEVFAEGCSFYKLVMLFFIGAFLGDITEMIFCRLAAGVWMSRSSVVWGNFSIVWGLAMVLATLFLYNYRDRSDGFIFMFGTVLGGAYEYLCSVFTEIVFGKVFWDYSQIPFNLGGRINLLYCFFWGIAAVIWLKKVYPILSKIIEKIPMKMGKIASWILIVFMICNMLVSAMALIRHEERAQEKPAEEKWEQVMDTYYGDDKIKKIYPNAISVQE